MANYNMGEADIKNVIHIFFLLDQSGSMSGSSIQTLNEAMSNVIYAVTNEAMKKEVSAQLHILSFSDSVHWLLGTTAEQGIDSKDAKWVDISAGGSTDTADAIRSILNGLSRKLLGHHAYRPIIVLITDGYSNNAEETKKAIAELDARQKTIRVAIGVDGYNAMELDAFASIGTVKKDDMLGNEMETNVQKLIFPVQESEKLADIITQVTVSSLISSQLLVNKQEENEKKVEEDPNDVVIHIVDEDSNDDWLQDSPENGKKETEDEWIG